MSKSATKKAQQAVEAMEGEGLAVTPSNFVDLARPKRSAFHSMFEWDDKKAGHQHRLNQARGYISLVVEVRAELVDPRRSFHSVRLQETSAEGKKTTIYQYERTQNILRSKGKQAQKGDDLFARLVAIVREAEGLYLPDRYPYWKNICALVRGAQSDREAG